MKRKPGKLNKGKRDSEEATIRVRNGSLQVCLKDDDSAEWEQDAKTMEWRQKDRIKSKAHFNIVIKSGEPCKGTIPDKPSIVHIFHGDGVVIRLILRAKRTHVVDRGRLELDKTKKILEYKAESDATDYIEEIWIQGKQICTFTDADDLDYMDLKA